MDKECARCAGCGQIATDDDGTPWKYWAEIPPPSNLAVTLGMVRNQARLLLDFLNDTVSDGRDVIFRHARSPETWRHSDLKDAVEIEVQDYNDSETAEEALRREAERNGTSEFLASLRAASKERAGAPHQEEHSDDR
jgi:hypothetical protein